MRAIGSTASPGPAIADLMITPMIVFSVIVVIGYAEIGLAGIAAAFGLAGLPMSLFCAEHTRLSPLIKHAGATGASAW